MGFSYTVQCYILLLQCRLNKIHNVNTIFSELFNKHLIKNMLIDYSNSSLIDGKF